MYSQVSQSLVNHNWLNMDYTNEVEYPAPLLLEVIY